MRENCQSGLEGGARSIPCSYPYHLATERRIYAAAKNCVVHPRKSCSAWREIVALVCHAHKSCAISPAWMLSEIPVDF